MADANTQERRREALTPRELDLIHELVRTRVETDRKLEYESLDGYELPPRTQFSMLKKPAISIKYGHLTCNMAAIRLFDGIRNILPMLNGKTKRLAIVPCAEEESSSVEWAYIRTRDSVWANKSINSYDFTENIFQIMGWNRECRYKVLGRLAESDCGLILVFDFEEAIMFEPNKEEVIDPVTGEIKKRQVKYYPDYYKGRIGRSYSDYQQAKQLSLFENLEAYSENTESQDGGSLIPSAEEIIGVEQKIVETEVPCDERNTPIETEYPYQ